MLTVCLLSFGDEIDLFRRASAHLRALDPRGVSDYRILLNSPRAALLDHGHRIAERLASEHGVPAHCYAAPEGRYKYPLMRRVLYDEQRPCAPLFFWCDDDTYLQPPWSWQDVADHLLDHEAIGQLWHRKIQGRQTLWVMSQPWFNPQIGPPLKLRFMQGSCWGARTASLRQWNWPPPGLRHCGGDSLLGALAEQQQWNIYALSHGYGHGAHINADLAGRHSKSPRRGHREPEFAADFLPGREYDTSHQQFSCKVDTYAPIPHPPDPVA